MAPHPTTLGRGNNQLHLPTPSVDLGSGLNAPSSPIVIEAEPTQIAFPPDFALKSGLVRNPTQATLTFSNDIADKWREWSEPTMEGRSLALATIFAVVLHKFSGNNGVAFTLVSGRSSARISETAALTVEPGKTLRALARELADGLTSGNGPAEKFRFATASGACRAAFDACLEGGVGDSPSGLSGKLSHDLVLRAVNGDGAISLIWSAPQGLFCGSTLQSLGETFMRFAAAAANSPDSSVRDLPFVTPTDRESVIEFWNATQRRLPTNGIAGIFREQALRRPDAVALSMGDQRLSYSELDGRANRMARILLRHGVSPGTKCSVCLDRSPELVVSILGILKAGAAYVALGPSYPRDRITYMHTATQARAVISRVRHRSQLEHCRGPILCWEDLNVDFGRELPSDPSIDSGLDDLACVSFTSGSTGTPKGVEVTQRGCIRLVVNANYADLGEEETFLLHSPLSFDASTFELWAPLLNGGRLEILPTGQLDLRLLGKTIAESRITTLWLTAALFTALVDERLGDLRGLRQLITGGDVVSVEHARRFRAAFPACRLINGYGPTENTTFSTCHSVREEDLSRVSLPIGTPIANSTAYILDPEGQPVPPLFPGELFVGGEGVARGYLGDPALAAERFVSRTFGSLSVRLYRTGDRARWLPTGAIEFLGRFDHQVKIDGYRVELGEIEAALLSIAGIRDAMVVAFDVGSRKQLAAFVVGSLDVKSVQNALRGALPVHLVPPTIKVLPSLPLNLHGKVDRSGLLKTLQGKAGAQYGQPKSFTEKRLHLLWAQCLGSSEFGVHDDFFDLGGTSLNAAKLFAKISREFGRDLPLATLIEAPTIAQLGTLLTRAESLSEILVTPFNASAVSGSGTWFLIPGAGSDSIVFVDVAKALKSTHAVVGLQARPLDGSQRSGDCASIPVLAKAMVSEIISLQCAGPFLIGGHCFGAVLAWEIANQLESIGHTVGSLALLDPIISDVFSDDVFGGARWPYHWKRLRAAPWNQKLAYVGQRCSNFLRTISVRKAIRPAQKLARQIHASYSFPPRCGRVCVILASDSFYGLTPHLDPRRFYQSRADVGGFSYHIVGGDHDSILHESGAADLAAILGDPSFFVGTRQPV